MSCGTSEDKHLERNTIPSTNNLEPTKPSSKNSPASASPVQHLNTEQFKAKVFDYTVNQTWNFKGDKPCIIDFYADWCAPCKMLAPTIEEIARKYEGRIDVYKINTDQNRELSQVFNIQSIPTVLFCPVNGDPQATMGVLQKAQIDTIISNMFKL